MPHRLLYVFQSIYYSMKHTRHIICRVYALATVNSIRKQFALLLHLHHGGKAIRIGATQYIHIIFIIKCWWKICGNLFEFLILNIIDFYHWLPFIVYLFIRWLNTSERWLQFYDLIVCIQRWIYFIAKLSNGSNHLICVLLSMKPTNVLTYGMKGSKRIFLIWTQRNFKFFFSTHRTLHKLNNTQIGIFENNLSLIYEQLEGKNNGFHYILFYFIFIDLLCNYIHLHLWNGQNRKSAPSFIYAVHAID